MKARVAVLAALVAAVTVTSVAVTASGAARQDSSSALDAAIVSQWNATAQAEAVLLRPTAHGQSRGIAMVEGAVYDAVNAIDGGYQPYLLDARFDPEGSQGAAAATAAYRVLLAITPAGPTRGARCCIRGDAGDDSRRCRQAGGSRRRGGSCRGNARLPPR